MPLKHISMKDQNEKIFPENFIYVFSVGVL